MIILGIETSCDETAAAIVEDGTKILSNIVASSADIHAKTGGVIPEIAARQQIKSILPVIELALKDANTEIDAIAVTVGPGLIGSLLVGVETAKTLSYLWKKPIVSVNHLVGHIYANWFETKNLPDFPVLALVVSGGHTDLVWMENHPSAGSGQVQLVGTTRDDAAGEAFDKTARILGLPYPGGPSISAAAEKYLKENPKQKLNLFPRPMINEDNFDWSFSGLKTAVLREVQSNPTSLKLRRTELAAQVQEAIIDVLVHKVLKAIKMFKPKSFLLAGGVAANKRLREKLSSEVSSNGKQVRLHVPNIKLCTDNAAYIGSCACFNYRISNWKEVDANPELLITD